MLQFNINGQVLIRTDNTILAEGSHKYITASFTFSEDWNGITSKWINLQSAGKNYQLIINNNVITEEDNLALTAGMWLLSVYGTNIDGQVITTTPVTVCVNKGARQDGEALDIGPDISAQVLAIAQDVEDRANNGDFDGYTPQKGIDYYTEADKEEMHEELTEDINEHNQSGTAHADIREEVSSLNEALDNVEQGKKDYSFVWEQGNIDNNGNEISSTTYYRTNTVNIVDIIGGLLCVTNNLNDRLYAHLYNTTSGTHQKVLLTPNTTIDRYANNYTNVRFVMYKTDYQKLYCVIDLPYVKSLFKVAKNEECFVSPNGSDSNDGGKDNPFATVGKAIENGYRNICVMDGEYNESLFFTELNDINIYAYNYLAFNQFPNVPRTRPTFTNGKKYTDFTTASGYKSFSITDIPTRYTEVFINQTRTPIETVSGRQRFSAGLWANFSNRYNDIKLKPVLTIAELSEDNTFYFDGTNVYFNTSSNCNGVTVVGNNNYEIILYRCNNVHVNGINFEYAVTKNVYCPWCNNLSFENCEFGHSLQQHNAEFSMSDVTCINCLSYKSSLDGFNSAYYGVMRLVECKSLYNYDDGESAHEYCQVIIEGGEYAYNWKAGHAPVGSCKFTCQGTYSHDNEMYGLYSGANNPLEDIVISNSVFVNNASKDIRNTLYNVKLINSKYNTINVVSGTVTNLTSN